MTENTIDELINSLESLSVSKMSNEINYTLFKIYSDTIPDYDGSEVTLEIFINAADKFYNMYHGNDDALNQCVDSIIMGKLTDRAQILIGARQELNSWFLIKQELRNTFGDRQSLDNLEQCLFTLTLNKNEHPLDFAKRIQLTRSKLAFKINSLSVTEMSANTKLIHLRQYESQSLKVFLRNLNIRLRDKISVQRPDTLETAMSLFLEDENFNQTQNLVVQNRASTSQQFPTKQTHNTLIPKQQQFQRNFTYPNFQTPATNFQNQSQFPRQPINIQPRQIQHKFPTNRQVFGPPQNVFKPSNKPIQRVFEPMSTTSRNPTIQRSTFQTPMSIRQQQFPRQTFTSQELNTHEEENDEKLDASPQPYPNEYENYSTFPDQPYGYNEQSPEENYETEIENFYISPQPDETT